MHGDFKGDFSRDSFGMLRDFATIHDLTYSLLQDSSTKQTGPILRDFSLLGHFSRLLWQQGRVILDADLNEQIDILLYHLRSLAGDLIGPQGGPLYHDDGNGNDYTAFALYPGTSNSDRGKACIKPGHYYVDGIRVSNEHDVAYANQPYLPPPTDSLTGSQKGYLAYLDVWERQITALENDLIREFALGESGPDTATRAQLLWQVKVLNLDDTNFDGLNSSIIKIKQTKGKTQLHQAINTLKQDLENLLHSPYRGRLAAKAEEVTDEDQNNACIIPPAASYRGMENQLYRVEIHRGGLPWPDTTKTKAAGDAKGATFVVSRENGSVLFPILSGQTGDNHTVTVTLGDLGRDDSRFTLNTNDWVEVVDEDNVLMGVPGPLYQVSAPPDPIAMTVTLAPATSVDPSAKGIDPTRKQLLRLWNYRGNTAKRNTSGKAELADDGALQLRENTWFELENGIHIQFQPSISKLPLEPGSLPYAYRTGDYWLIPARTITGNVLWPHNLPSPGSGARDEPAALPPRGVHHHYAPLAYINFDQNGNLLGGNDITPLQLSFKSLVDLSS